MGGPGAIAVRECGRCHEPLMRTYAGSYHGKATLSGDSAVARCSDCHGYHDVRGAADPASSISAARKLATCRKCHHDAPPAFASFMPHVDPGDRAQAPLLYGTRLGLKGLVALLAAFFCVHTLAWLLRARLERVAPAAGPLVRRHGTMVRLLHGVGIVVFLALGASGAVMAFNEQPWAAAAIRVAGGMHAVGLVHRVAGAAALATFALHLAWAARSALERRRRGSRLLGPDSIVPRLSDARDLAAHVRWFAGRGPRPAWNRFAYWEKLQYWAVAGVIVLSGLTGLLLWFPTLASRHLPGALLNLAAVLHSVEALLAAAIVIAAHVAHALLRRGSAPLDQGMFTGVAAEEDYRRERAPEWARIEAEGRAEGLRCSPPARWRAAALTAFGVLASAGSIALLALAVYGLLST
jgi:cytochrome b subunit of formate dehydrogenase